MRAERLLRIILLLQTRGRTTANVLARQLGVSVRTIQRDMEALDEVGLPVYATRGSDGGWALVDNYRTSLAGLTTTDALALLVGKPRGMLADLGLDDPGDGPALKLLAAIAPTMRERVEHARQRIYLDLAPWGSLSSREAVLPQLQRAVWEDELIRVRYGATASSFVIAPLGLVCKGTNWYLVGLREAQYRTFRVSRMHSITATGTRFDRPTGFELVTFWQESSMAYVESFSRTVLKLRLRGDALVRVGWVQAHSKHLTEPDSDGWVTAELTVEDDDNALSVIRTLGNDTRVVEPDRLRQLAVADAGAFVRANTSG